MGLIFGPTRPQEKVRLRGNLVETGTKMQDCFHLDNWLDPPG